MYHILFRIKKSDKPYYFQFWVSTKFRLIRGYSVWAKWPFQAISLPFSVATNANRQDKYKKAFMFWHLSFEIDVSEKTSRRLPLFCLAAAFGWPTCWPVLHSFIYSILPYPSSAFENLLLLSKCYRFAAMGYCRMRAGTNALEIYQIARVSSAIQRRPYPASHLVISRPNLHPNGQKPLGMVPETRFTNPSSI